MIKIGNPYIGNGLDCNTVRLICDIEDDGNLRSLYIEVDKTYEKYLCYELSDAFLIAMLPCAMRTGQDIQCESPVTDQLLHNIKTFLIPSLSKHDDALYHAKIIAQTDDAPIEGHAVGAGFSCGIDSFHTLKSYLNSDCKSLNITHLYNTSVGAFGCYHNPQEAREKIRERVKIVAEQLGLPLIVTDSNYRVFSSKRWRHVYIHIYATMFSVFALRKLWKVYHYASSAYDLSQFSVVNNSRSDTAHYDLLSACCFSVPGLKINMTGLNESREEKLSIIADFALARKYLHVCIRHGHENCNICPKCKRTILQIDMLGKIHEFSDAFDVDYYLLNKIKYFKLLALNSKNDLFKYLYMHFKEKEPKLLEKAQKIVDKQRAKREQKIELSPV